MAQGGSLLFREAAWDDSGLGIECCGLGTGIWQPRPLGIFFRFLSNFYSSSGFGFQSNMAGSFLEFRALPTISQVIEVEVPDTHEKVIAVVLNGENTFQNVRGKSPQRSGLNTQVTRLQHALLRPKRVGMWECPPAGIAKFLAWLVNGWVNGW